MTIRYLTLIVSFTVFLPTAQAQSWNARNNPQRLGQLDTKLSKLPLEGQVGNPTLAWPGNHWVHNSGGIAHRWSAADPQNFKYKSPSLTQLRALSENEINQLSPAEKFDIYNRDYRYSTVKRVFSQVSPQAPNWHGICHGYTAAAMNHPEPQNVTLVNGDGIAVTFYSSDAAALLAYFYAKDAPTKATLVGERCYADPEDADRPANRLSCEDMNAGAFHVIVTNRLGLLGESFVADVTRFREVWNHVAVSYSSTLLAQSEPKAISARGTVLRQLVEMKVRYAGAISPKPFPVIGTPAAEYMDSRYQYWLDLNKEGEVIGGEWQDGAQPDFLWIKGAAPFRGKWQKLNEIYIPRVDISTIGQ
jgi:hypothetical protein